MTAYEIIHTHDGGTILEDSSKGDGALEILYGVSRRWRTHPEVGVYVRGTRDRDADRALIAASVAALQAAGHTVTVSVDNTPRPAAVRRADAAERAADKAERLTAAADKAERTADTHRDAARAVAGWEPGQPILRGHHSERGHRRAVERMQAHDQASWDAARQAERLAEQADGVRAHAERADDPRRMARRIETLQANVRRCERELDGHIYNGTQEPGAAGQRAEDLARWIAQDTEEITHLRGALAELETAGTFVAWTRDDFRKGDMALVSPGVWVPVLRVNAKSITVPWISMTMDGRETDQTDRVTYDKISGRRRDGVQLDAPNGQPRTLAPAPAAPAAEEATADADAGTVDARTGAYVKHNGRRLAVEFAHDRDTRDMLWWLIDGVRVREMPGTLADLTVPATLDALRAYADQPMVADVHRAHPVTSGPFCVAYDNHTDTPTGARSTFVRADVTCPACLATYEPGGDDPGTLQAVAVAAPASDEECSQCRPGHAGPDGRCTRHGKRIPGITPESVAAHRRARRVESVAAKLAAESFRAEPPVSIALTDDAIRDRLGPCVKPPAADLYPEIRTAYLAGLAEWQREHAPQPNAVRIERHRQSVTQGGVSVWYGGELVGRFGDDIRLCTSGSNGRDLHPHSDGAMCFGGWHGRSDRYWREVAEEWAAVQAPTAATVTVYGERNGQPGEMLRRESVTLDPGTDEARQALADEIAASEPFRPGEAIRVYVGRDHDNHSYSTAYRPARTAAEILGEPASADDQGDAFVSGWAALAGGAR